ncbi:hypothetical protein [Flavobacterium daemonense]|uniref:hypothetical protein n=1 Tax=Flavobacterium daemonense TaxID=1393049 RepID=UPI00118674AB|nr:hypothetical protein [Flavobacterium daemonense]KAF2329820.1 hypothetical protein FND99_15865 [Flavobacterium daemonense]
MNKIFFDTKKYLIDRKRKKSHFLNQFRIYNDKRECIGFITERKTFLEKIIRFKFLPFSFEIRNANGVLNASLSRECFLFCGIVVIKDTNGKKIGSIRQKKSFYKRNLEIMNAADEVIAAIDRNKKDFCFTIIAVARNVLCEKKQKEKNLDETISLSYNKYSIIVEEICSTVEDKMTIISSALTISILFKKIL